MILKSHAVQMCGAAITIGGEFVSWDRVVLSCKIIALMDEIETTETPNRRELPYRFGVPNE